MTAEFAVMLPALVVVFAVCISAVGVIGAHTRIIDAAATAARSLARGGTLTDAQSIASRLVPGSTLTHREAGDFVCATVSQPLAFGIVTLTATDRVEVCGAVGGL